MARWTTSGAALQASPRAYGWSGKHYVGSTTGEICHWHHDQQAWLWRKAFSLEDISLTIMNSFFNEWWVHTVQSSIVIQIKICAEYRDMLPRPRLVCQEPGRRPIGRSPGVPDKSSRGLGSMSRYSAQVLICFIVYIFLFFFHSFVGLVGNFAGLPVCTVPSPIVHCNQNEAGHQIIKAPSMPCWGAAGRSKHSLAFKSQPGENDR